MKIIELEQGSTEWHALRRLKIGASDCATIMGKNPYKTPYQLWREKVLGESPAMSPAMQRGTDLEPVARAWIEDRRGISYPPVVVESSERNWQIASLDGLGSDYEYHILEIKCPGERIFAEIESGKVPEYWLWQVQHQLSVCQLFRAILLAFNGTYGVEVVIQRDDDMISRLTVAEEAFYRNVIEFTPPSLGENDYLEQGSQEWIIAASGYDLAKKAREAAEKDEELFRKKLIDLADGKPSRGQGITLTKYFRKGNVDYAKIPQLKGIDLEPYRKAGAEQWRIS